MQRYVLRTKEDMSLVHVGVSLFGLYQEFTEKPTGPTSGYISRRQGFRIKNSEGTYLSVKPVFEPVEPPTALNRAYRIDIEKHPDLDEKGMVEALYALQERHGPEYNQTKATQVHDMFEKHIKERLVGAMQSEKERRMAQEQSIMLWLATRQQLSQRR